MLNTLRAVAPYVRVDPSRVNIDNLIFKLHYRWTFVLLSVATILVSSRQYTGDHIKCLARGLPEHVVNTFCFFTPTFTVVRQQDFRDFDGDAFAPHYDIGPWDPSAEPIKRHAYYQWVPFLLSLQAICFYMPHYLWKCWEGGRVKSLVEGLRRADVTPFVSESKVPLDRFKIPSPRLAERCIRNMRYTLVHRLQINRFWGYQLLFAELINLGNLLFHIYLTNCFLGGNFYRLGLSVLQPDSTEYMHLLDEVFPKMTKCTFNKFGPSGSLQTHDALCVMALNVVNEKIFLILWFWYAFLLLATVLNLLWRIVELWLHGNKLFSYYAFPHVTHDEDPQKSSRCKATMRCQRSDLNAVVEKLSFSNWLLLLYLASNVSEFIFARVIENLAFEMEEEEEHELKSSWTRCDAATLPISRKKRRNGKIPLKLTKV